MKKKINVIAICIMTVSVIVLTRNHVLYNEVLTVNVESTKVDFTNEVIDLGKIPQGIPITKSFSFVNVGDNPLIIQNVETSCGCTQPKWPGIPIEPGKNEKLEFTYDAKKSGKFHKTITIFANIKDGIKQLTIKGEVIKENKKKV